MRSSPGFLLPGRFFERLCACLFKLNARPLKKRKKQKTSIRGRAEMCSTSCALQKHALQEPSFKQASRFATLRLRALSSPGIDPPSNKNNSHLE